MTLSQITAADNRACTDDARYIINNIPINRASNITSNSSRNMVCYAILGIKANAGRKILAPDYGALPQTEPDELVERAYEDYCRVPASYKAWFPKGAGQIFDSPVMSYDYSLNPAQIDLLLSKFISTRITKDSLVSHGLFLSCMIQKSYTTGQYDKFSLNTGYTDIPCLCCSLKAEPDRRMNISINGVVGEYCADRVEYVDLDISGRFHYRFMNNSRSTTVIARGHDNTNVDLVKGSLDCQITVADKNTYDVLSQKLDATNTITLIDDIGRILDQKNLRWQR